MRDVLYTFISIRMRRPYLMLGLGPETSSGIPRAMTRNVPNPPLWWQKEGVATVFRLSYSKDWSKTVPGEYGANLWWASDAKHLPNFRDPPVASGTNTLDLLRPDLPDRTSMTGHFPIHGSNSDLWPVRIQFASRFVTFDWTVRARRAAPGVPAVPMTAETITLVFR